MRAGRRVAVWITALVTAAGVPIAVAPLSGAQAAGPGVTTSAPARAAADTTACSAADLEGDSRLGPATLPTTGALAPIVAGYKPLGGYSNSTKFLGAYWDTTANNGQGGWRYPPLNGYRTISGQPDEFPLTLNPGLLIDRFGSEFGSFLAPAGTPYGQRALPPQSLDNPTTPGACNYNLYKVLKAFDTSAGPIAPGFGQKGGGLQYRITATLLPAGASANVRWLLDNGYLARVS